MALVTGRRVLQLLGLVLAMLASSTQACASANFTRECEACVSGATPSAYVLADSVWTCAPYTCNATLAAQPSLGSPRECRAHCAPSPAQPLCADASDCPPLVGIWTGLAMPPCSPAGAGATPVRVDVSDDGSLVLYERGAAVLSVRLCALAPAGGGVRACDSAGGVLLLPGDGARTAVLALCVSDGALRAAPSWHNATCCPCRLARLSRAAVAPAGPSSATRGALFGSALVPDAVVLVLLAGGCAALSLCCAMLLCKRRRARIQPAGVTLAPAPPPAATPAASTTKRSSLGSGGRPAARLHVPGRGAADIDRRASASRPARAVPALARQASVVRAEPSLTASEAPSTTSIQSSQSALSPTDGCSSDSEPQHAPPSEVHVRSRNPPRQAGAPAALGAPAARRMPPRVVSRSREHVLAQSKTAMDLATPPRTHVRRSLSRPGMS